MMTTAPDDAVRTRKVGSEDVVVTRIPASRFRDTVPPHLDPPLDDGDVMLLALLAQSVDSYVFDGEDAGATSELHVWLRAAPPEAGAPIEGADVMLGSMRWLSIASATSNPAARERLESFGFSPAPLQAVRLQDAGGAVEFLDGGSVQWSFGGLGKGPVRAGVYHEMLMPAAGSQAPGHRVSAVVTNAHLERPASLLVRTTALEPYLRAGESLSAHVHRMPHLDADVVFHRRNSVDANGP